MSGARYRLKIQCKLEDLFGCGRVYQRLQSARETKIKS